MQGNVLSQRSGIIGSGNEEDARRQIIHNPFCGCASTEIERVYTDTTSFCYASENSGVTRLLRSPSSAGDNCGFYALLESIGVRREALEDELFSSFRAYLEMPEGKLAVEDLLQLWVPYSVCAVTIAGAEIEDLIEGMVSVTVNLVINKYHPPFVYLVLVGNHYYYITREMANSIGGNPLAVIVAILDAFGINDPSDRTELLNDVNAFVGSF